MREQGWGEDELVIELAELERAREPALIWPDNWLTVNVFLSCQWTLVMGMQGGIYQGISAREIEAACRLQRVQRAQMQEVLAGVRVMVAAASPILNEKKDG